MRVQLVRSLLLLLLLSACGGSAAPLPTATPFAYPTLPLIEPTPTTAQVTGEPVTLNIYSAEFAEGEPIPSEFTCDGENTSPEISWDIAPAGTKSLALIMDDPDAPGRVWVHWVLFNLPGTSRGLPAAVPPGGNGPDGSKQGPNSFGRREYGGPCPPSGTHRYVFKLYALNKMLDLPSTAGKDALLAAMEGHIMGMGQLTGTYSK